MKPVKIFLFALLAGILILPFIASCAHEHHHPNSTLSEPEVAPDTSVPVPEQPPVAPPPPAPTGVNAPAPPPPPPTALPYLKEDYARARAALGDGVYREAAVQIRNAAELMDQVIVTAPYYTEGQPWLVAARDDLHALADQVNRGEDASMAAMDRAFARAFRAVARFQSDLARPATQPADAPAPPWAVP